MSFFAPKTTDFIHLLREITIDIQELAGVYKEFADKFDNFEDYCKKARVIEERSDEKVHNIINELNRTFITPLDREDIYALAHQLDDVVDMIENVMKNIQMYQITKKKKVVDDFTTLIVQGAAALENAVRSLDEKKTANIKANLLEIHRLEDAGDEAFAKAMSELFREEKDPINLIKWKDIIQNLEDIMDKYQVLSNIIEGITVKMS